MTGHGPPEVGAGVPTQDPGDDVAATKRLVTLRVTRDTVRGAR